ncbi:MAG: class I SAM-dependent methyltransferase [Chloroflexota bacterium]|nr:MAG: class I SAM-dependent methyltransferase [Chloroflexota bacterium]
MSKERGDTLSQPRPASENGADGNAQPFLERWADSPREPLLQAMRFGRLAILLAAFLYTRLRAATPYLREMPAGARVLDYGCGTAKYTLFLERARRLELVGIDISARAVQHGRVLARGLNTRSQLLVGDCQALPFEGASFDGVFSLDVLAHLPDPGQGIAEIARVLRPGGLAAVYAETNGFVRHRWTLQHYLVRQLGFDPLSEADLHVSLISKEELERLFAEAGLEVVATRVAPEALLPFSFLLPAPGVEEACRAYPQLAGKPLIRAVRAANMLHGLAARVVPLRLVVYLVAAVVSALLMPFLKRDTGGVTFKLRRRARVSENAAVLRVTD